MGRSTCSRTGTQSGSGVPIPGVPPVPAVWPIASLWRRMPPSGSGRTELQPLYRFLPAFAVLTLLLLPAITSLGQTPPAAVQETPLSFFIATGSTTEED